MMKKALGITIADDVNEIKVIEPNPNQEMKERGLVTLFIFYAVAMVESKDFEIAFRDTMEYLHPSKCYWWIKNCVADEIVYNYDELLLKGTLMQ